LPRPPIDNRRNRESPEPDWPRQRTVSIRLDAERYAMLESWAHREGLAPTTMARVLVIRGLRREEDFWE
jgi:hypothetical protein